MNGSLSSPSGVVALTLLVWIAAVGLVSPADAGDREDAMAAVAAYHHALATQDSVAAVALLADDVVVLESGYFETRDEYLGHHLGADMEFAGQVASERQAGEAVVEGDVAWISSTSTMEGEFRGREIRSAGVETMVLSRIDGAWRIRAIHWSSRRLAEPND
jgi:ketosteroid isomerase-like protein